MATLEQALGLAAQGFHVFPCIEGSKLPAIDGWQDRATTDPEKIKAWWIDPVMGWEQNFNIGICTTRFNCSEALVVVDVDAKNGKNGYESVLSLELEGFAFPQTLEALTPTGGQHLFYRAAAPVKQGAGVLGDGIDIRSRGGYVCAAGSETERGRYSFTGGCEVAAAPQWIIDRCGAAPERAAGAPVPPQSVDAERAFARGQHYLTQECPVAEEGERNHAGYLAACRLKDYGVAEQDAAGLMLEHWPCQPMLDHEEVEHVVRSAYRYGKEVPGTAAPEVDFPKTPAMPDSGKSPLAKLNDEYAFVVAGGGGHILWETTDADGQYRLEHLALGTFHAKLAAQKILDGKREVPITQQWMEWKGRRSYDGLVFRPGEEIPERFYNLWRGFSVEPAVRSAHPSVEMFLEHALVNVCHGSKPLFRWLMGYFAHCVQHPGEKPLTSLVFKGDKGVGKNALVERVGALFSSHFMVVSDRRYLVGNFNGHLENCLMFVLDEAFWSGDKQAEGVLKTLVTGTHHVVEHKGKEPYKVDNKTRVVIIGNEDWIVPASHDERRFAVFQVGDGRKQDRQFFHDMRVGLETGGYAHLLRYFLDFDLTGIDVNQAPDTVGLLEQKHASLEPMEQWWLDCLHEGRIQGSDFDGWPERLDKARFRDALHRYWKQRNIRTRLPDEISTGRRIRKFAASIKAGKEMRQGTFYQHYLLPDLRCARDDWCKFIGHEVVWEADG